MDDVFTQKKNMNKLSHIFFTDWFIIIMANITGNLMFIVFMIYLIYIKSDD